MIKKFDYFVFRATTDISLQEPLATLPSPVRCRHILAVARRAVKDLTRDQSRERSKPAVQNELPQVAVEIHIIFWSASAEPSVPPTKTDLTLP